MSKTKTTIEEEIAKFDEIEATYQGDGRVFQEPITFDEESEKAIKEFLRQFAHRIIESVRDEVEIKDKYERKTFFAFSEEKDDLIEKGFIYGWNSALKELRQKFQEIIGSIEK